MPPESITDGRDRLTLTLTLTLTPSFVDTVRRGLKADVPSTFWNVKFQ